MTWKGTFFGGAITMKISNANIKKFDQSERDKAALFDFGDNIENNIAAAASGNLISENPGAAVVAGMAAIAAPIAGMAFTGGIMADAAEVPLDQDVQATYVDTAGSDVVEVTETIQDRVVNFTASGPGHIEPADNCVIDGETGEIKFIDANKNAMVNIVYDVEGAEVQITAGDYVLGGNSEDIIILEAHGEYPVINLDFTDVVAEQRAAAEEEARRAAEEQEAAERAAAEQAAAVARAAASARQAAEQAPQQQAAPAPVQQAAPAPVQQAAPAPAQQATSTAPFSGAAQHSMTPEELAEAHQIFDSYNNYRASKGLSRVAWSDDCANMAFGSATGCAASGHLTHRLGIPAGVQLNYSDILQYSTWKMKGADAVHRWSQSDGHRMMMQCETAQVAGVAAYNNGGTWYYAIVYNFSGTNQNGS